MTCRFSAILARSLGESDCNAFSPPAEISTLLEVYLNYDFFGLFRPSFFVILVFDTCIYSYSAYFPENTGTHVACT